MTDDLETRTERLRGLVDALLAENRLPPWDSAPESVAADVQGTASLWLGIASGALVRGAAPEPPTDRELAALTDFLAEALAKLRERLGRSYVLPAGSAEGLAEVEQRVSAALALMRAGDWSAEAERAWRELLYWGQELNGSGADWRPELWRPDWPFGSA